MLFCGRGAIAPVPILVVHDERGVEEDAGIGDVVLLDDGAQGHGHQVAGRARLDQVVLLRRGQALPLAGGEREKKRGSGLHIIAMKCVGMCNVTNIMNVPSDLACAI